MIWTAGVILRHHSLLISISHEKITWWSTSGNKIPLRSTLRYWVWVLLVPKEADRYEPQHDKTNKMTCAPIEDSDQPGHPPSLIRVFAVRSMGSLRPKVSSCGQRRLWSHWVDAQAELSLRWAHMSFCWFCHEMAHIMTSSKHTFTSHL